MSKPKRPRDVNELAKLIAGIATGEVQDKDPNEGREGFIKRARAGGLKGGKARATKLSSEKRTKIAKKAAEKRWDKK